MFIRVELSTVMLSLSVGLIFPTYASAAEGMVPQLVHFKGPGAQPLIGYLFRPGQSAGRAPGIILLHGRTGPYSTAANGLYDATTLSKRHELWGRFWAQESSANPRNSRAFSRRPEMAQMRGLAGCHAFSESEDFRRVRKTARISEAICAPRHLVRYFPFESTV